MGFVPEVVESKDAFIEAGVCLYWGCISGRQESGSGKWSIIPRRDKLKKERQQVQVDSRMNGIDPEIIDGDVGELGNIYRSCDSQRVPQSVDYRMVSNPPLPPPPGREPAIRKVKL